METFVLPATQNFTNKKSIAVLPFVNMSNDPEQEYISEGVAEEIINSLSNLKDLRVAGRSSSFQIDTRNIDLREVGEKLGVSTVLEGSVRKQDNKLRITVQLINVEDGFHLWSEKYDRHMGDIFAIQDEIALGVTEKLRVTLLDNDRELICKAQTRNTKAYELYLKGRFHINRRGPSLAEGIQFFRESAEADPSYARAHAGYADTNLLCALYGLLPPLQAMDTAREAAEKAIQLDPSLCEPYCSLGFYYTCCAWNWKDAEKNFLMSLELNPKYAQAHYWYGLIYLAWAKGDFAKAQEHGEIALQLEPRSAICHAIYGGILHAAGKDQEALAICNAGLKLEANSYLCQVYKGRVLLSLKEYQQAADTFEEAMKYSGKHYMAQNGLITAYILLQKLNKASVLMYELKERNSKHSLANAITGLAVAYLDTDSAIHYLEKAFKERDPFLISLKNELLMPDVLKEDKRFQALLDRIEFP
jgi:adenylate cyclase